MNPLACLCNVREGVARLSNTLHVLLLQQRIDRLLDVRYIRLEALRDLRDDLLDQRLVLHGLTRLHDSAWKQ